MFIVASSGFRELLVEREVAERQSSCELEVDVVAADILNRLEVGGMYVWMFLVMYSKHLILWLTHEWLREMSVSRLECGIHDKLDIYPVHGTFYFPWHRHQIEGTNGF